MLLETRYIKDKCSYTHSTRFRHELFILCRRGEWKIQDYVSLFGILGHPS